MSTLTTDYQDKIAILRLKSGVTNPINPDLVDELSETLAAVKKEASGMMLCGGSKFFSIGFDLPELLQLDRPAMSRFWEQFNRVCFELFTVPVPTVCALSGHAVAGGNILALACDYRYGSSGKMQIGLNELKLGVPVPYLADMMLRHTIGNRYASQMVFSGEFMPFSDAKIIGLIDAICPPDELEEFALERLSTITGFHNQAFAAIKANKVEKIKARYENHAKSKNEQFLDCWFSDPVQTILNDASKKF